MQKRVESKNVTSFNQLPINRDRPPRVLRPAHPATKAHPGDPLPSSQKGLLKSEAYESQGRMAESLVNNGHIFGSRSPSKSRGRQGESKSLAPESSDDLFGNILNSKELPNQNLEVSETMFENGLFPLQKYKVGEPLGKEEGLRPRVSLHGRTRELSASRAEDGRTGETQRKKTPNLRAKTPPHKMELTTKTEPEVRTETPKLPPNDLYGMMSPVRPAVQDSATARAKLATKSKADKKENPTLPTVNDPVNKKPGDKPGARNPDSSQSLDKPSPFEFILDVPQDRLTENQFSAFLQEGSKSQVVGQLAAKAKEGAKPGLARGASPLPSKGPLLPTSKAKPDKSKDATPLSHPKPVSSVVIANKMEPVPKAQYRSTARSSSQTPSSSNLQTDTIEWIINNLITIPPVFKATVELSRQPGYFLVASNTHNGTTRAYNEDRVKITTFPDLTKKKKLNAPPGPETLGVFSVFDGHGSSNCSQFLFDRLHTILLERCNNDFAKLTSMATGLYQDVDSEFRRHALKINDMFAGSCSCTLVQCNKTLWALNLGDSRCILSKFKGTEVKQLTYDHKPSERNELERIVSSGGSVFRAVWDTKKRIDFEQKVTTFDELDALRKADRKTKDKEFGPWRVNPGGLSVSRCFGDFECKGDPASGAADVVSVEPDVSTEPVESVDFALIGCQLISGRHIRRAGKQRNRADSLENHRIPPRRGHQVEA